MKNNLGTAMIALLMLAIVYFVAQSGTTVFEATMLTTTSSHTDKLDIPRSSDLAEAFFDSRNKSYTVPMTLQASVPLTDKEAKVSFVTVLENPLDERIMVQQVTIIQNDIPSSRQIVNVEIQPGMSNIFRTQLIPLEIEEGKSNTVLLEFLMESDSGESFTETFEYTYYALSTCTNSLSCAVGYVCDLENIARYSNGNEFYCVLICGSNSDCPDDQLCIKGRCGY